MPHQQNLELVPIYLAKNWKKWSTKKSKKMINLEAYRKMQIDFHDFLVQKLD